MVSYYIDTMGNDHYGKNIIISILKVARSYDRLLKIYYQQKKKI